jgi:hypothetical protein
MTHYLFTLVSSYTTWGMAWAALGLNPRYNHQSIVDDALLFFYLGEQSHNPGDGLGSSRFEP